MHECTYIPLKILTTGREHSEQYQLGTIFSSEFEVNHLWQDILYLKKCL